MGNSAISDDGAEACCSIVVWDMLFAVITSGFAFAKLLHMHWALSVILAIIVGIAVGVLMLVRFLGTIIQFCFSIIWCIVLEEIFGIYEYLDKESIKMWAIRAGAVLIFFGFHLLCNFLITEGNTFFLDSTGEYFSERVFNGKSDKKKEGRNSADKKERKDKKEKKYKIKRAKKRDRYYAHLEILFRISKYRSKISDIEGRLCKLVEKRAVSWEEWNSTHDVLEETKANYNDIESKKVQYSTRPKMRCKQMALIISDIQSKRLLINENIEHMEQSLISFEKRMEEAQRERHQKKENYNYQENSYNDSYQSKYGENQNSNGNNQQNTEDTALISLFAGCNDKESLRKRYRELMKIYHPDNFNGDNEMCQKIQSIYEKLCNKHKDNS